LYYISIQFLFLFWGVNLSIDLFVYMFILCWISFLLYMYEPYIFTTINIFAIFFTMSKSHLEGIWTLMIAQISMRKVGMLNFKVPSFLKMNFFQKQTRKLKLNMNWVIRNRSHAPNSKIWQILFDNSFSCIHNCMQVKYCLLIK